jgi:outer membrane murein-binding lipoprotein Lpp
MAEEGKSESEKERVEKIATQLADLPPSEQEQVKKRLEEMRKEKKAAGEAPSLGTLMAAMERIHKEIGALREDVKKVMGHFNI